MIVMRRAVYIEQFTLILRPLHPLVPSAGLRHVPLDTPSSPLANIKLSGLPPQNYLAKRSPFSLLPLSVNGIAGRQRSGEMSR
jgi:hypothetical protein